MMLLKTNWLVIMKNIPELRQYLSEMATFTLLMISCESKALNDGNMLKVSD
jgi:hypothetical protein